MRNTLTRVGAFIASLFAPLFAGAPPPKRSTIVAKQNMRRLAEPTEPVKHRHRHKTGGPNWLKIALNSRR